MPDGKPETAHDDALDIAAKETGLRPDQVRRAVEKYRAAALALEAEPEWEAVMHMSGRDTGLHQYAAVGTAITMQIESWKERGEWKQERLYAFAGRPFELYSEARAVELSANARPIPYRVSND